MRFISADTADKAWQEAIDELLYSSDYSHDGRSGKTYEIIPCVFQINNPRQRWVLSRHPSFNPAFAFVEFLWILSGNNESKVINFWNPTLPQYTGAGETYHGAYGFRLRKSFGIDQIQRAYNVLVNAPETRQVALQIWKPEVDLPADDGSPASPDIPCNMMSILKIRGGSLHWTQVMRSNDIMRGFPYDVIQFTLLQELMAAWLNVNLGSYVHVADSLHIYKDDIDTFECQPEELSDNSISIPSLPFEVSNHQLSQMYSMLSEVAEGHMSEHDLKRTFDRDGELSKGKCEFFQNMISVIGSDAARRMHYVELSYYLVNSCTDVNLKRASISWLKDREVENVD
jgi:thymidylate synthase